MCEAGACVEPHPDHEIVFRVSVEDQSASRRPDGAYSLSAAAEQEDDSQEGCRDAQSPQKHVTDRALLLLGPQKFHWSFHLFHLSFIALLAYLHVVSHAVAQKSRPGTMFERRSRRRL
jgi:hypothetical protein